MFSSCRARAATRFSTRCSAATPAPLALHRQAGRRRPEAKANVASLEGASMATSDYRCGAGSRRWWAVRLRFFHHGESEKAEDSRRGQRRAMAPPFKDSPGLLFSHSRHLEAARGLTPESTQAPRQMRPKSARAHPLNTHVSQVEGHISSNRSP